MRGIITRMRRLELALCLLAFCFTAPAQTPKLVILVSRHGIRSPLESMTKYTRTAWPDLQTAWGVQNLGDLTPHGQDVITLLGAYYRAHYVADGLLSAANCPDNQIYFRADTAERTQHTAMGLVAGLGCGTAIHSCADSTPLCTGTNTDPLFHPVGATKGVPDGQMAVAQITGRIGSLDQLLRRYRAPMDALQSALLCCSDPSVCPSGTKNCTLPAMTQSLTAGQGSKAVSWKGPFPVGSDAAEIFELEYANNMDMTGWGRVTPQSLHDMSVIHTVYFDYTERTSYLAQIGGSNLAAYIMNTLGQAVTGVARGQSAPAGSRFVALVGHDTNVANLAAMLGVSWTLPGYQTNDPAPGGALVFELHERENPKRYMVRVYYQAQSLRQMRDAVTLTLSERPGRANLAIPGCSDKSASLDCAYPKFQELVCKAIDWSFVSDTDSICSATP
jgi:4-phytase / acid phosphatase